MGLLRGLDPPLPPPYTVAGIEKICPNIFFYKTVLPLSHFYIIQYANEDLEREKGLIIIGQYQIKTTTVA